MVDVRELVVRINAIDSATRVVDNLSRLIEETNNSTIAFKIDESAIEDAKARISSVYDNIATPVNITADASAALSSIENFSDSAADFVNSTADQIETSLNDAFANIIIPDNITTDLTNQLEVANSTMEQTATISEKLSAVWQGLKDAGNGAKDTINGMTDSINMASVAIGAVVGLGANAAFKDVARNDAFKQKFQGAEGVEAQRYIQNLPVYANQDDMMDALMKNQKNKIDLKTSTQMMDTLGKVEFGNADWFQSGRTAKDVMERLTSMKFRARGFVESKGKTGASLVNRSLTEMGIGELTESDIKAAEKSVRASGKWNRGTSKEDKAENYDKIWFEAARMAAEKKVKPIDWDNLLPSQRVQIMMNKLDNLKSTVNEQIVPVLVHFIDVITTIITTISKIPGATQFIAYVTVFGSIAVIASRLSGTFGMLALGIGKATAALKLYQTAALAGNTSKIMQAQGLFGPVQQLGGSKAGLNASLQRLGSIAGNIGLATTVKDGKVTEGLFASMATASRNAGGGIRGAFMAASRGVVGAFGVMKAAAAQFFMFLLTNPLVAVGALIIAIVLLAYKFGYLKRAWNAFANSEFGKDVIAFFEILEFKIKVVWAGIKGLFSILMGGIGSKLSGGIVAVFEAIAKVIGNVWNKFNAFYSALKGGDISLILGATGGLFESLGFLGPIFWILSFAFKLLKMLYDFLKEPIIKIKEFLGFIWNVLTSLWKWLMKAIPGAEKATTRLQMEKEAKKFGLGVTAKGSYVHLNPDGTLNLQSAATPTEMNQGKLKSLQDKYNSLPGFAEGIADAVKQGLSGLGKQIGDAIAKALGFDSIANAIDRLIEALTSIQTYVDNLLGRDTQYQGLSSISQSTNKGDVYTLPGGRYSVKLKDAWNGYSAGDMPEELNKISWSDLVKYGFVSGDEPPEAASGGIIQKSGILFGHAGEPIIPAKLASSSALIDTLTKIADSKRVGGTSGDATNIYNTFNFHSHGSSGFDAKTKSELTTFIDNYMARALRHRQAH